MIPGFDTASSIALIAVTALAKKGSNGTSIPNSQIVLFPVVSDALFHTVWTMKSLTFCSKLLFTSGMTLIDSCDSILMLYSYSGFPERSFFIFSKSEGIPETIKEHAGNDTPTVTVPVPKSESVSDNKSRNAENDLQVQERKDDEKNGLPEDPLDPAQSIAPQGHASDSAMARDIRVKMNMMSGLSIILTLISILVAFRYDYSLV